MNKTVNFENAKKMKRLGYNTESKQFYLADGESIRAYAIDVSSELLWYVPSYDQVATWLKTT